LPDELLLTNGTDEAIHLVCEAYLAPGDKSDRGADFRNV
jgi:histidinol-phosphate/aromatic aminotransferase/cobyric acid decarboxylase-like protein